MNNVISFPQKITEAPQPLRAVGAKTLFIHIKSTTLIAHLAAPQIAAASTGRLGKTL